MGKPLMLEKADNQRIEVLKKRLQARSKLEVVRTALDLLERETDWAERIARWRRSAASGIPEGRTSAIELPAARPSEEPGMR